MNVNFALTSLFLAALACASAHWISRRNPALSPSYSTLMFLLILAYPLLRLLPTIDLATPIFPNEIFTAASAAKIPLAATSHSGIGILTIIWLIGVVFLFIRQSRARLELQKWLQRAEKAKSPALLALLAEAAKSIGCKRLPALVFTRDLDTPAVAGLLRPVIFLPECAKTWDTETQGMVLLHELTHLHRRDLITAFLADLTCALHWFNPLVWMLKSRLHRDCEFACDAKLLRLGTSAKSYALALCAVAENSLKSRHPRPILAMASGSNLRRRVENVLDSQGKSGKHLWLILLISSLCISISLALFRPQTPTAKPAPSPEKPVALGTYTAQEIHLRQTADPFPAD